jgi:hypothetical protein
MKTKITVHKVKEGFEYAKEHPVICGYIFTVNSKNKYTNFWKNVTCMNCLRIRVLHKLYAGKSEMHFNRYKRLCQYHTYYKSVKDGEIKYFDFCNRTQGVICRLHNCLELNGGKG